MKYLVYNPLSGKGDGCQAAETYAKTCDGECNLLDIRSIESFDDFINNLKDSDEIIIFGGDGTLNRFVNSVGDREIPAQVFYMPAGTGNDFFNDIAKDQAGPVQINQYIKGLPTVTVEGKDYKFINGIGFGIDGYCCEVGDKIKESGKQPNYTAIAIKGLLFHHKPTNATVSVDGKEYSFKKVWIAPTMYGKFYGGGMMPAPLQERGGDTVSLMLFHGSGKLKTLMIFPSLFKGTHVKHEKHIAVISGKNVTVKFDAPTALQIDGETHLNITEYSVRI